MSLEIINISDLITDLDPVVLVDDVKQLIILVEMSQNCMEDPEYILYYLEHLRSAVENDGSLFVNHANKIVQVFSLLMLRRVPGTLDDLQCRVSNYAVKFVQALVGF